jgi:2-methylcitrate dehydratase PrpD
MAATRPGAAFANGVAVAVNNQCDSYHMLTNPGVLIVPAGLATAEGEGRTGRELLAGLAAGYEVQCRCAGDFIPSTPARYDNLVAAISTLDVAPSVDAVIRLTLRAPA